MCAPRVTQLTSIRYSKILATHASTRVHRYSSLVKLSVSKGTDRCVQCHPWCTHRTFLIVQKNSFPVALNNSINVGPLAFLL
jgi:hypothetical protein